MRGRQADHMGGSPLGVGILTVLMILTVLCLATFATLTLSSARADYRLSRINADTVTAYYEADIKAAALAAAFAQSEERELVCSIPVTDVQTLELHLVRDEDGGVVTLRWQVTPIEQEELIDEGLPVFIE